MQCPCQSGKLFSVCCERYLLGVAEAPTAETLMRSRYSAYATQNIGYIQRTAVGPALEAFSLSATQQWMDAVTFTGLRIVSVQEELAEATVTFVATYVENGVSRDMLEVSLFKLCDGRWRYLGKM